MKRLLILLLLLCLPFSLAHCETLSLDEMLAAEEALSYSELLFKDETNVDPESGAREDLIDRIIATAKALHDQAGGRAKRVQYSGDIYVCKNFTVHLFRENRSAFRMAEYPDVELVIPNNQKKADCAPYVYGVEWQDVPASEGNPFYAAATFRYDYTDSLDSLRLIGGLGADNMAGAVVNPFKYLYIVFIKSANGIDRE